MPIIFRVGSIWHYRFQVDGKRRQRSTGERIKSRALLVAEREYQKAKLWARGDQPVLTLAATIDEWLKVHEPIVSTAHFKAVQTLRRLHLYDLGDVPLDELTTEHIELALRIHLKNHAPASANHWLRILRLVCKWAVRRKVIPMVTWSVKLLKVQKRPRATLPVPVAMRWLKTIDELSQTRPGIATAVRLMFGLGLRESETITARWEWIDWDRRTYTPGITKGREAQAIPTPLWLIDHLKPLAQPAGLIVTRPCGQPFSPGFTRRVMRAANAACEIDGVTPHRLRGTFATLLSEAGVPIQTIQRVLRHKSHATTMSYLEERFDLAVDAQARIAQNVGFEAKKSKTSGEKMAHGSAQSVEK